MLIHHEEVTVTATDSGWDGSGTWKANTANRINGMMQQVYIESATSTTQFKFKMLDNQDRIIYDSESWATNILRKDNLNVPVKGIYEMQIYGPTTEEQFKILLGIREE